MRVLDTESNYIMSALVPTPEIAKAQALCQKADDQEKQFAKFQVTLSTLEVEMTTEDALIKICIDAHDFGSAGDKLTKSQPARPQTVKKQDMELKGLLTTQEDFSDKAVVLAQALTGKLATLKTTSQKALTAERMKRGAESGKYAAQIEAQNKKHAKATMLKDQKHSDATTAAKALHDESHKAKDEAHKEVTKKMEGNHKAAVKVVTAALYEAEDQLVHNISKMVTVNQAFLMEVRLVVKAVKDAVLKRKDYESVFVQVEDSIKENDAELLKFLNSATGPKDSILDTPSGKLSKSTTHK